MLTRGGLFGADNVLQSLRPLVPVRRRTAVAGMTRSKKTKRSSNVWMATALVAVTRRKPQPAVVVLRLLHVLALSESDPRFAVPSALALAARRHQAFPS